MNEIIEKMVDKFLSWRLPPDFNPDAGIIFKPPESTEHWPVGTNLLTAFQAKQMVEHITAELLTHEIPVPLLLWCPECGHRHVDQGEFAEKPHHTHACQNCGHVWRPAIVDTVGVKFLPGFKDENTAPPPLQIPDGPVIREK